MPDHRLQSDARRCTHHREPFGQPRALLRLAVDLQTIRIELERERFTEAYERIAREPLAALDASSKKRGLNGPSFM
jgi:hypothetical protein